MMLGHETGHVVVALTGDRVYVATGCTFSD
jgi:hypothetical protein